MQCPRCGSAHVVKHGFRVTVKRGRLQMWQCQSCGHVFTTEVR